MMSKETESSDLINLRKSGQKKCDKKLRILTDATSALNSDLTEEKVNT